MFFERNKEELNNILNETRALLSVGDINAAQNYLVKLSGSDSFNKWKHLVFENEYKRYISREPCLTNEQLLEESGYYQEHSRDEFDSINKELLAMVEEIRISMADLQTSKFRTQNEREVAQGDALRDIFIKLQDAGIDLTDQSAVASFLDRLRAANPTVAEQFENTIEQMLGEGISPDETQSKNDTPHENTKTINEGLDKKRHSHEPGPNDSMESDQISTDDLNHIFNDNTEAEQAENTVVHKNEPDEEYSSESQWERNSHKYKLQADVDELVRRRNHLQSDGKPETPKHDEIYWTTLVAVLLGIGGFFFWPLFIITAVLLFYRFGTTEDNAYKLETEALEEYEKDLAETKRALESAIAARNQYQNQVSRQEQFERYKQIRKEIEAMPRYKIWRDEVLQRFGSGCVIGSDCAGKIEVDHYPVSMYQLVKKSGLLEINDAEERRIRAYEFTPFWSVNNGAPLCKKHHDKTTSSKRYHFLKKERDI